MGFTLALPPTTLIIAYWQRYVTKESIEEVPETPQEPAKKH